MVRKNQKKVMARTSQKGGANRVDDNSASKLEQTTYDTDRVEVVSDSITDTLARDLDTGHSSETKTSTINDDSSLPTLRGDVCATSASASIIFNVSKFRDPKIRSKNITVRLDTGADVTCIPKHLADSLKLEINTDPANTLRLLDASGNLMLVYGSAEVFLTPTHGSLVNQTKKVQMIVTDQRKNPCFSPLMS